MRIIDELRIGGLTASHVSVLASDHSGLRAVQGARNADDDHFRDSIEWLSGIGSVVTAGLGPFVAAGPIVAWLTNATFGGLTTALMRLGLSEADAIRRLGMLHQGAALIIVQSREQDHIDAAIDVFNRCGGTEITTAGQSHRPWFHGLAVY